MRAPAQVAHDAVWAIAAFFESAWYGPAHVP